MEKEIARFVPDCEMYRPDSDETRRRVEKGNLQEYGIPWQADRVMGCVLTPGERVSVSRMIRTLKQGGYVQLTLWQDTRQIANVRLTPAGRKVAERL